MILRTPALISLVLLLTLGCAQPSVQPMSGINAIVGDRSWIETYGVSPPARGAEDARIATHLVG